MRISGHEDARIFDRYNITDSRDIAEAMVKLGDYEARKREARKQEAQAAKNLALTTGGVFGSHAFTDGEMLPPKPTSPRILQWVTY
jgi:hypothetical protein